MPSKLPTQQMGDLHEAALAEAFGGRKTKASGSQWHDQGDVRNNHDIPFAFCLDGKSTLGKSITVTLDMIAKVRDQAQGERPGFGLRWYGTEDLKTILEDFVLLQLADVEELLPAARAWVELEAALAGEITPQRVSELLMNAAGHRGTIEQLQRELHDARTELDGVAIAESAVAGELGTLRAKLTQAEADRDQYKAQSENGTLQDKPVTPSFVPRLPWTIVHIVRQGSVRNGIYYDHDGYQHSFSVGEIRVERTGGNRPKLMVNNIRVRDGDLYIDGELQARACSSDPSIEKG